MSDEELCARWMAPLRVRRRIRTRGRLRFRAQGNRTARRCRRVGIWTDIVHWQVRVGMTQCAAFAAWGTPSAINKSMTANGQSIQFVFENRPVFEHRSVYTGRPRRDRDTGLEGGQQTRRVPMRDLGSVDFLRLGQRRDAIDRGQFLGGERPLRRGRIGLKLFPAWWRPAITPRHRSGSPAATRTRAATTYGRASGRNRRASSTISHSSRR